MGTGGAPSGLPADYGSGKCATWDAGVANCNSSSPGLWCEEPWCYVDAEICHMSKVPYMKSSYHENLFLSYGTCHGDASKWIDQPIADALSGKVLRAAVPVTYSPDHFKVDANQEVLPNFARDADIANGTG